MLARSWIVSIPLGERVENLCDATLQDEAVRGMVTPEPYPGFALRGSKGVALFVMYLRWLRAVYSVTPEPYSGFAQRGSEGLALFDMFGLWLRAISSLTPEPYPGFVLRGSKGVALLATCGLGLRALCSVTPEPLNPIQALP